MPQHKILDLIGALALLGRPIHAHVIARNAGQALNIDLVLGIHRALESERRLAGATRSGDARAGRRAGRPGSIN